MGVQVETLTKGKSMHETEYIDFSYKGKKLSEFGLVVVSNGDRLSFGHSPNFEDEITQVNGTNGQLFWGTHFKNFQRTFHLATDGMSEAQWNAFKRHFIPGQYGEFIEHHLPSRKSYCRVREISVLNIIPFQETITLYGEQIQVNVYKGDCSISLEWDDPHYYSISNYITKDEWEGENSKGDSIRAMYTDNIPRYDSWKGGSLCCIGDEEYSLANNKLNNNNTITASQFCFYNPSTASTDCQLELTLPYVFTSHIVKENLHIYYIDAIGDTYNDNKNDSIIVQNSKGEEITAVKYTSPNIIYQINKAIYIAMNYYKNNTAWNIIDLEEQLREEITNPKVMSWAANAIRAMSHEISGDGYVVGRYCNDTGKLNNNFEAFTVQLPESFPGEDTTSKRGNWLQFFNYYMLTFFGELQLSEGEDSTGISTLNWLDEDLNLNYTDFTLKFDSKLHEAYFSYNYNNIVNELQNISVKEEKCGDIMLSDYLKLDGGDSLDESNGTIATYHTLSFKHGEKNDTITKAKLIYQYVYL